MIAVVGPDKISKVGTSAERKDTKFCGRPLWMPPYKRAAVNWWQHARNRNLRRQQCQMCNQQWFCAHPLPVAADQFAAFKQEFG